MRIVVVGAGSVARRHVEVLTGLGARVVGVVDPDEAAAGRLAAACGATATTDVGQALDDGRPDAAYVCVPPFAHGPAERAVLARGLPLFVEKPVGLDPAVAEEVAGLVERAGVVSGTGYHWRCLDTLDPLRERAAAAPPLLAVGSWLDKRPPVAWWGSARLSGGQVVEQLTHVLDLARSLLGEAAEVHAVGVRRAPTAPDRQPDPVDDPVDDATAALVRFASGAVASFTATSLLAAKRQASLQLCGPGWWAEVDDTRVCWDEGNGRRPEAWSEDPRVAVDREFLEAVRGERAATRAPYAEAVRSHRLAWAVSESARTGGPVRLDAPSAGAGGTAS
ncbi:Gfo/Idh/MocA family oxidoreductase [Nocardioides sp. NPDC092400]|uniref:Gfo/Idh/MocA family protein n=1 Tax=Nocardioides sp. NPDC092400 TaxID=3155196 RepID=UPI003424CCC5